MKSSAQLYLEVGGSAPSATDTPTYELSAYLCVENLFLIYLLKTVYMKKIRIRFII